jgi:putative heme-binding domain-containing protein
MVYEGELLPAEYRGAVLEVDAGTRQVNGFPIIRQGAAFRTESQVFLSGDDPWFRPVDACAAPDGSVFVADWYDAGVGGHAFSDQTTGRIYRVAPKGHKSTKPKPDFATVEGLIAALKSPTIATQDVARRGLIQRAGDQDGSSLPALGRLLFGIAKPVEPRDEHRDPIYRARALWVCAAIFEVSDPEQIVSRGVFPFRDADPRIREQIVRALGRDCRENGQVDYSKTEAKQPPAALKHLSVLLTMADDSDAGVRRGLILALRNLPTDRAGEVLDVTTLNPTAIATRALAPGRRRTTTVGDVLRKLAAAWDGRDRWYLEALGLALAHRDSSFLSRLFDGSLYGELDLERSGKEGKVALPPYFPVDRNEAFIPTGSPELPVTALSKYLGLAWRLHCREALPLLKRMIPYLRVPELQEAGDDVLEQMKAADTAVLVAGLAQRTDDLARRRELYAMLATRLSGDWRGASLRPEVVQVIERALADPETRVQGLALVAADTSTVLRHRAPLEKLAEDPQAPVEVRIAAIEAMGALPRGFENVLDRLIATVRGKPSSDPIAEAAARAVGRQPGVEGRLTNLMTARDYPLGLRREALRTLARLRSGGSRVIELARAGKLPDDLKTEATTLLYAAPERRVRAAAAEVLPLPKMAGGRPLPPIGELIRRDGDPDRGRAVFFRAGTNSCGGCHRVQGRGHWVGPDLSTIGVKSGRDELIRSILNPSAAIGSNFRSLVLALDDGRVLTGLPVDESTDHLVLKTAAGDRITIRPGSIADRRTSDVSLMPEGLAQAMTETELVDLLAYLTTLRQPVSIVGQYYVIGPLDESAGTAPIDPASPVDLEATRDDGRGRKLSWRRTIADTEGLVDLSAMATLAAARAAAVYAYTPVVSPVNQKARLVLDTPVDVAVWRNGRPVPLSAGDPAQGEPRTATVDLPQGQGALLIRVALNGRSQARAHLVTTFVVDQPVGFTQ